MKESKDLKLFAAKILSITVISLEPPPTLKPLHNHPTTKPHNYPTTQLPNYTTTQLHNYTTTQLPNGLVPMTLPGCYIKALLLVAQGWLLSLGTSPKCFLELPRKGASCCLPAWLQVSSLAFGKSAGSKVLSGWLPAPALCLAQGVPV